MQTFIAALIVIGCSGYAAWALLPAIARRSIASALLALPLPGALAAPLRRVATMSSGCGCDGCDHAPTKTAPQAQQVVTFHPRLPR